MNSNYTKKLTIKQIDKNIVTDLFNEKKNDEEKKGGKKLKEKSSIIDVFLQYIV